MSDRFFVEFPVSGESALLTGQEATHLTKVLRARVGDDVLLFDGSGSEFLARITEIKKDSVHLAVLERRLVDRELSRSLAFGIALPKGERQRVLVEKLTELGVTSLTPLITARSVVQPDAQTAIRLRRTVIEASKQCGRNRLMMVTNPCKLTDFLDQQPINSADSNRRLCLFAHPRHAERALTRAGPDLSPGKRWDWALAPNSDSQIPQEVTIAIGPEGGFTDEEYAEALAAGWLPADLGPRTLRVETAAIAFAAFLGLAR